MEGDQIPQQVGTCSAIWQGTVTRVKLEAKMSESLRVRIETVVKVQMLPRKVLHLPLLRPRIDAFQCQCTVL